MKDRFAIQKRPTPPAPIKYIDGDLIHSPVQGKVTAWGRFLPGQGMDGYGSKITTDHQIEHGGKKYRVFATCFSNVASNWVLIKGEKFFVR